MICLSLFDYSGNSLKPWRDAGYECHLFDIQHTESEKEGMICHSTDIMYSGSVELFKDVAFISAFPPCTDLASSGAQWWKRKAEIDPDFQKKAMELVLRADEIARIYDCPYYIENPKGVISRLWRKWNYRYQPCDFTGYTGGEKDNYTKETFLWTNKKFVMPEKKVLGGLPPPDKKYIWNLGSAKRHSVGSITPPGFSRAVFEANKK